MCLHMAEKFNGQYHYSFSSHTTRSQTLPQRILHTVQSNAFAFSFQYPVFFKVIQYLLTFSSLSSRHFYPSYINT